MLTCAFCGKSQREVAQLIAGPKAHICDACVSLCLDIIDERREGSASGGEGGPQAGAQGESSQVCAQHFCTLFGYIAAERDVLDQLISDISEMLTGQRVTHNLEALVSRTGNIFSSRAESYESRFPDAGDA